MNIITLLNDFNIPYSEEGKNVSAGWIGMQCPFCDDTSNHLGYNMDEHYFSCWKCGGHPTISTIMKLLGVSEYQAKSIMRQYRLPITNKVKPEIKSSQKEILKFPVGTGQLQDNHKIYLAKRGFDPDEIENIWNLKGTGPYGKLDNINYKHRIIIPYRWDGRDVSFTARDITNKQKLKYITCPAEYEVIEHKSILYGKQETLKSGRCILVEGPSDVWRFGTSSCAVSGIKYTFQQVHLLASYDRVAICFDDDPQARIQAAKIVAELRFRGVDAFRVDIEGDPGSMKQEDADYLVKQLIH